MIIFILLKIALKILKYFFINLCNKSMIKLFPEVSWEPPKNKGISINEKGSTSCMAITPTVPIIYNKKVLKNIFLLVLLNIRGMKFQLPAFVDIGATQTTLDSSILPPELLTKLVEAQKPLKSMTFSGTIFSGTISSSNHYFKNLQIQL